MYAFFLLNLRISLWIQNAESTIRSCPWLLSVDHLLDDTGNEPRIFAEPPFSIPGPWLPPCAAFELQGPLINQPSLSASPLANCQMSSDAMYQMILWIRTLEPEGASHSFISQSHCSLVRTILFLLASHLKKYVGSTLLWPRVPFPETRRWENCSAWITW